MNPTSLVLIVIAISMEIRSLQTDDNDLFFSEDSNMHDEAIEFKYPNVLSMKFHLMHSRVPKLLTKISLLEMKCPISYCSLSMIDIVDAIRLDTYETADITSAIEKTNITGRDAYNMFLIYNVSVPAIESFLAKAGITFSDAYKNFVESLHDPANTIPHILGIVNVSAAEFMNAVAYSNDTRKLEVLLTGNYSYENIQAVLNATNKTGYDLLGTLPLNTLAKNVNKFLGTDLVDFIKNLGVTSSSLDHFYKHLNVTSINFIAYPGFTQILNDLENYLNPEQVLATVISGTKLVTNNKAKSLTTFQSENTDFVRNYSYYQAEHVQNPLIHYHVKNVILSNREYKVNDIAFVEVFNSYKGNFSELLESYNGTKLYNCTYVTKLPFGEFYTEDFPVLDVTKGHLLALAKSNRTLFNLGSPLFCQDKLVAIASQDAATEIQFSTFLKKSSETSKPSSPGNAPPEGVPTTESSTKPGAAATICLHSAFVFLIGLVAFF